MKNGLIKISIVLLIIIILVLFTNINSNYIKSSKLYISEILATNDSIIQDDDNEYSDYIEIYNGYNTEINLEGYNLSDSEFDINKWTFPKIKIGPHEYLIVYASGKNKCDIDKRICHTNFKLSSLGETLTFTDKTGNIISKFSFPVQYADISYGYSNRKYIYLKEATPGKKNNDKEYKKEKLNTYKLEITEYMTHNNRNNYDSYGNYYDWVEIYNSSNNDYKIDNIYITDNMENLKKYKISNQNIKSHEYLIIYFAGKNVAYYDGVYANFSLSDDDKVIAITDGNKIIDKVEIVKLLDNISYGKVDDKWKYFTTATPGRANTTASFDKIGGLNGSS